MRRLLFAAVLFLAACGDNTGPGGVPTTQLHIVQQDTLAPPLMATQVSFWAKVGSGGEVHLNYQGDTPSDTGQEFVRLEVPGDALYRKADGGLFQPGDSVYITLSVVDPTQFLFHFEPAGLRFSTEHPARLKVRYFDANHDFNDDGVADSSDDAYEQSLDVWYRMAAGAAWFRVGAVHFEELEELDANIFSFSDYSIAW
jgi:hypothetical protein